MTVESETVPVFGDFRIDNILSGARWAGSSLTYSFPSTGSLYSYYPTGDVFTPPGFEYGGDWKWHGQHATFTEAQKTAVRDTMSMISSFTGLAFTEATETTSSHADLRYSQLNTYDLSNYTNNLEIDLEVGAFSNFYRVEIYTQLPATQLGLAVYAPGDILVYDDAEGNVANALLYKGDTRSLIENAVGGSGVDWMKGNVAANHLSGGDGKDALLGKLGDDVLKGGSGADVLIGDENNDMTGPLDPGSTNPRDSYLTATVPDTGDHYIMVDNYYNRAYDYTLNVSVQEQDFGAPTGSTDTASYSDASAAVTASLGDSSINTADAKGDKYISIENLRGSDFNDTLAGDETSNVIDGGRGDDTVVFGGKRSDYTVSMLDNGSLRVTDNRSGGSSDGIDTLIAIENMRFSDTTITAPSVDEVPVDIALSGNGVKENVSLGAAVGTFSAKDPEGKALTYGLTDDADGLFTLSSATLVTAKSVDYEGIRSDKVAVEVSDGTNSVSKTFTIAVQNVNEAPRLYIENNKIFEGSALQRTVGTTRRIDPEGKNVTLKLIDDADGMFRLFGAKLITAKALDHDKVQSTTVTIQASDGVNKANTTLNIRVLDGMANPQIGDTVAGTNKADWVYGYDSDDILIGNGGFDELMGGRGGDRFVFRKVSDMGTSDDATDYITDFSRTEGHIIDVSALDANSNTTRNDAFTYIGSKSFSKTPGELRAETAFKSFLYKVSGDVDGDGNADFRLLVHIKALSNMMASELIL